jgi:hypothetical protein
MFVRMSAYSSRRDKSICTKIAILIPWDQEENKGGSKLRESVLSSIPDEGGSCSLETKHYRRTAPRALMMEAARTSETLVNFYKTTRCCNPEDSHLRTQPPWEPQILLKTKVVCFDKEITRTKATTPKISPAFESRWDGFCSSENKHDIKTAPRPKLFVLARRSTPPVPPTRKTTNVVYKEVLGWIFIIRTKNMALPRTRGWDVNTCILENN